VGVVVALLYFVLVEEVVLTWRNEGPAVLLSERLGWLFVLLRVFLFVRDVLLGCERVADACRRVGLDRRVITLQLVVFGLTTLRQPELGSGAPEIIALVIPIFLRTVLFAGCALVCVNVRVCVAVPNKSFWRLGSRPSPVMVCLVNVSFISCIVYHFLLCYYRLSASVPVKFFVFCGFNDSINGCFVAVLLEQTGLALLEYAFEF